MKRLLILLACWVITPSFAWDPAAVFHNAVRGQINRQINRGMAGVFRSIETPSASRRSDNAEIRDARPGEIVLYGTPNCGYCKQAREHLQSRGVPLTIMGSHKLTGFSAASFYKTYARFQTEQASAASTASGVAQPVVKPPSQPASQTVATYSAGDLLSARIALFKVLAEPRAESSVLSQLDKNEDVIFLGEAQGRYIKIKSTDFEGWAEQSLLAKL